MGEKILCLIPIIFFIAVCIRFQCTPSQTIGAAFCHQIAARSPMFGQIQFPFCHRCAGLFAGIFCVLLYASVRREKETPLSVGSIVFLGATLFFYGIDILNSTTLLDITLYPNQTHTRFLSGFAAGTGIAVFILPLYRTAFPVKKGRKPSRLFRLGFLSLCAFLFHAALFSGSAIISFPLQLILCTTAVSFLMLLYSILIQAVAMLKGKAFPPRAVYQAAAALAFLQIDVLSFAHLWLTASGMIQF